MGNNEFEQLAINAVVTWYNKCMLSTVVSDGRYYELTYNGERGEYYLDVYSKEVNICVPLD